MTRIRLRVGRGDRSDVVEVPLGDHLLGSSAACGVVIDGVAERHAWLRPRRGRLLLAPTSHSARRPALDGVRVEAPVVLAPGQAFQLANVHVRPSLVDDDRCLTGRAVGDWRCGREVGSPALARRTYFAMSPMGSGWVHQVEPVAANDAWRRQLERVAEVRCYGRSVVWFEPGEPAVTLDVVFLAQATGSVGWPTEAGIVLVTQLVEALCEYHDQHGPHGALRPALVAIDGEGRLTLSHPDPWSRHANYQPERVRLGGAPDFVSDAYGWWRLALGCARRFPGLSGLRTLLPTPPVGRAPLLVAAEGVRRWAVRAGFDPTGVHLARGIRLMLAHRAKPLVRVKDEKAGQGM